MTVYGPPPVPLPDDEELLRNMWENVYQEQKLQVELEMEGLADPVVDMEAEVYQSMRNRSRQRQHEKLLSQQKIITDALTLVNLQKRVYEEELGELERQLATYDFKE